MGGPHHQGGVLAVGGLAAWEEGVQLGGMRGGTGDGNEGMSCNRNNRRVGEGAGVSNGRAAATGNADREAVKTAAGRRYVHPQPAPRRAPDSMTASVPSNTAFATSVISARVGSGLDVIDSSICVAVTTNLPAMLALVVIIFWASATFSEGTWGRGVTPIISGLEAVRSAHQSTPFCSAEATGSC